MNAFVRVLDLELILDLGAASRATTTRHHAVRGGGKPSRRPALEREIEADALAKPRSKRKLEKRRDRTADEEEYLPDALSTKILSEAKALREEDERAAAATTGRR